MNKEFRKASEVLASLFSNFDSEEMHQANSFISSWNEIVGEKIASHSKVIDVDHGSIIVEADHPGWSQQILIKKKQILNILSRNYPDLQIKNIIIRVVTECKEPYEKQNIPVGSGIPRIEPVENADSFSADLNKDLNTVLERLKKSIKKGKPTE